MRRKTIITKCDISVEKKIDALIETRRYSEKRGKRFVPVSTVAIYNLDVKNVKGK